MLASYRARLLAGFAIVIVLALFLSASAFILLLREQQAEAAQQRIGVFVGPVTQTVHDAEFLGYPPSWIRAALMDYAENFWGGIRVLVVDANDEVIIDTHPNEPMHGQALTLDAVEPAEVDGQLPTFYTQRATLAGDDLYLFTASDAAQIQPPRPGVESPNRVVIAVPAEDVTAAWARLLPRLGLAGLGAGVVAVIFASLFASRITNPIAQMTRAAQAMAQGDLNQRIDVHGDDEVGRLSAAFNLMSSRVSRSDRAMRDLLADVSHELKTPLTSIQGFSQALVDGIADDPREVGELINEEANRIRLLVDDLLYLSEIESGTLRMEVEPVDVDAVAEGTMRRLRFAAADADVELRAELDGGTIRADGRRLEQVLANLLDNAIRFAPPGTAVMVSSRQVADGVLMEVHNWGDPIPEEHRARVFDRFYQADHSRSEGGRHRGLGLSIVQELVQAHGGSVSVESTAERGTTFSVFLPGGGPATSSPSVRTAAGRGR